MKKDFQKLEALARETGYTVRRKGREIEWKCNSIPDHRGSCSGISEVAEEIRLHHRYRLGSFRGN